MRHSEEQLAPTRRESSSGQHRRQHDEPLHAVRAGGTAEERIGDAKAAATYIKGLAGK